MRIALYGFGRMGQAIEKVALERGHSIGPIIDHANAGSPPTGADVAIEFSKPDQALANIALCLEHNVPVVVGTTGWYENMGKLRVMIQESRGTVLWASNFSIGVNLFFRLNRELATLMNGQPAYRPQLHESHHIHKLDAPSGTAITLARDIDLRHTGYSGYQLDEGQVPAGVVPIRSERIGEVPGTHSVAWEGPEDRLTITHEAFGRTGFATGAVVAAEWLQGRNGLFTMDDVLDNLR